MQTIQKIQSYFTVPYLPILGPVNPNTIDNRLIADLMTIGATNKLLAYDKNTRWFNKSKELIFPNGCFFEDEYLLFTTIIPKGLRAYYYPVKHSKLSVIDVLRNHNVKPTEIYTFSIKRPVADKESNTSTVFMFEINSSQCNDFDMHFAHDLSYVQHLQLSKLGDEATKSGFAHLVSSGLLNTPLQPTIVILNDNEIVGAIGPLSTLPDNRGVLRLLPCYFGVLAKAQQQGIGSKLWQQSLICAAKQNAKYSIIQAATGTPAEKFYVAQGLQKLGYVHKLKIRDKAALLK